MATLSFFAEGLVIGRKVQYFVLCFLILQGSDGVGQAGSGESADSDRLKERVTQFYTAIQKRQYDQAALCVLEKSRSRFKKDPHEQIFGFKISEIDIEESGKSAVVETGLRMQGNSPFVASIVWPRLTRWRLVKGNWFCDTDNPPPTLSAKLEEYEQKKQANPGVEAAKFDKSMIDIGVVARGKTVTLTFPFTNLSSQTIKIEKIYPRGDFTKDKSLKTLLKPQEKGEVVIDLDTSDLLGPIDHSIVVEFEPIKAFVQLRIQGKVFEAKALEVYTPPASGKIEAPRAPRKEK